MIYDGVVQHVEPGRKQTNRLEVALLTERMGKPFLLDDAYLFVRAEHTSQLVGSLLQAVQHTGERVRLEGERTPYGFKVRWASKMEGAVPLDTEDR